MAQTQKRLTLSTKILFGKYKNQDKNVYTLIMEDIKYVDWLLDIWEGEIDSKVRAMFKEFWERGNETKYGKRNDINYAKK